MRVSEAAKRYDVSVFTIRDLLRLKCLTRWQDNPAREKGWISVYEDEMENAIAVLNSDLEWNRKVAAMRDFKSRARRAK